MRTVKGIILAAFCLLLMVPIYFMVMNSFTPARAFLKVPPDLLPYKFTLVNYQRILALPLLLRWVFNTLVIMAVTVTIGILANCAAGYVFAFYRGRWATILFWVFMAPMFVTRYVLIISQFVVIRQLHLSGFAACALVLLFWPTGIFLSRNYFRSIPVSLVESARIDGASEFLIMRKVVLPISKPLIGASVAFLGMGAMGDYIWQFLNLQKPASKTFLVGLLQSSIDIYVVKDIGYSLAVGTALFIPYLIVFALSSRYFITGLTGGALKE